ncbi:hypothetical protein JTB14_007595 [Gonioctena quinquepunctata]|nr:hypothetical protein JTB14_007595 [Gonioctena quinquepunctata]
MARNTPLTEAQLLACIDVLSDIEDFDNAGDFEDDEWQNNENASDVSLSKDENHEETEQMNTSNDAEIDATLYTVLHWTRDLIECMVENTNLYAVQQGFRFQPTNAAEMKVFIGIHILMGNIRYPRVQNYWEARLQVPIIANSMSRNHFYKLRQHLHFVNTIEKPNNNDRFWKVRPLFNTIRKKCLKHPLEKCLCVDEQMMPLKGSTTELDETFKKHLGLGAAVVWKLAERISEQNVQLYHDNFFSNYQLLQYLRQKQIGASGTARLDHFKAPRFSSDKLFQTKGRGTSEELISDDGGVILTEWFDNKAVTMASNYMGIRETDRCKKWDKKQKESFIRSKKLTLRMFTHGIDLACVNAWLEYRAQAILLGVPKKQILDLLHFRAYVGEALILSSTSGPKKGGRPSDVSDEGPLTPKSSPRPRSEIRLIDDVRFDGINHLPELDDKNFASRCKNENCSGRSRTKCSKCKSIVQGSEPAILHELLTLLAFSQICGIVLLTVNLRIRKNGHSMGLSGVEVNRYQMVSVGIYSVTLSEISINRPFVYYNRIQSHMPGFSLSQALDMLNDDETMAGQVEVIFITPPDVNVDTDEDSGDEDGGGVIYNMTDDDVLQQGLVLDQDPEGDSENRISLNNWIHEYFHDDNIKTKEPPVWMKGDIVAGPHQFPEGYGAIGTVRENRVPNYCTLMDKKHFSKQARGHMEYVLVRNSGVLLVRWMDNAIVTMASTSDGAHPIGTIKRYSRKEKRHILVNRPQCIAMYNKNMGGTDLMDHGVAYYRIGIRGKKWYWPIFT